MRRYPWVVIGAVFLVLLGLGAVPSARAYSRWQRRMKLKSLVWAPPNTLEVFEVEPDRQPSLLSDEEEAKRDDATLRMLANRTRVGDPPLAAFEKWMGLAHQESRRWAHLLPGAPRLAPLAGEAWVNLGPTDQGNMLKTSGVDSGRLTAIAAHPLNPDVVYVGTSGGGVWKSTDFTRNAPTPTWKPITEALGSLAIGAVAIDPTAPDTIYVGVGDAFDVQGNAVFRSTDGGATWGAPVFLAGSYAGATGTRAVRPASIRELRVDPSDPSVVFASTDVGLFRSVDEGRSFALVDLPNADAPGLGEAVWSVVFLGAANGQSHWLASGVQACEALELPPKAGRAAERGETSAETGRPCLLGNAGHFWRSGDRGATWSSLRDSGALPLTAFGRVSLAAGKTINPSQTVVYAYVGSQSERKGTTLAFWRSRDGGRSFVDASGVLGNEVLTGMCNDWPNLGHDQTYYNQAIAVDPGNDDHVIAGGNVCGVRTTTGTQAVPVWELVAHWFPEYGPLKGGGSLPYVHADWHVAEVTRIGGQLRVLVGSDGGLFSSKNVFTAVPAQVVFDDHNRGIVSHLCYAVGSGDPANGNAYLALTGLQDNGTRYRDYSKWRAQTSYQVGQTAGPTSQNGRIYRCKVAGTSGPTEPSWPTGSGGVVADGTVVWEEAGPIRATVFNEILGGDGIGTAVNKGTSGEWIWASIQFAMRVCNATAFDCGQTESWLVREPEYGQGDGMPFLVQYSPVQTDPTGGAFLTATYRAVWKSSAVTCGGAVTTDCCPVGAAVPCWSRVGPLINGYVRGIFASQTIPKLYGAVLWDGTFAVTSDESTWSYSSRLGLGPAPSQSLRFASSIAFPADTPPGKTPGDVFVAASAASVADDGNVVPDALGHLFLTEDRGQTWRALHGNGTGQDLPNVPIMVVRYDPGDSANRTLYVGTHFGVYRTTDGGDTWHRFGQGLPLVRVDDIFIAKNSSLMRIATYGRGVWEIFPSATAPAGVLGDGDFDRNQQIDFRDLGALASRLGTSPASTGWPTYLWHQDLTAPAGTSSIDERDLAALLGKFGGRP